MDKIILGLLLLKRLTIYELRNIIRANMKDMCSDSTGSIQAAIKKLIEKEMIFFEERVEKSINKKIYYITPKGRECFLEWLEQPMTTKKAKDLEISKLFFMGLAPKEKRIELIEAYIAELTENLGYLEAIREATLNVDEQIERYIEDNQCIEGQLEQLTECAQVSTVEECVRDISIFNQLTLDYGISSTQFQINWYEDLKMKLQNQTI